MKLYETSVKRPVAVTMAVLIFFVMGTFSMTRLSMDMMPDMSLQMLGIITQYSGVAPAEIENLVTIPIENAVSAVSGAKNTSSMSSEGSSVVMVEFNNSTDIDQASLDVKDRINLIKSMLPEGCDDPMTVKFDPSMMPVAMLSFSLEGSDLTAAKEYVENNVTKRLEAIDGVASVSVDGGSDREIHVDVDTNKLFGYNISLEQLVSAIASENTNLPGGTVTASGRESSVRSIGKFNDLKDLEEVPIRTQTGELIYLRDVAAVNDTYSDLSSYARLDGSDSLSISIQKQSGSNTVDVVNAVVKTLEQLKSANPNIQYKMTFEQASYIQNAISSVAESAVLGAIFAVLVLFLFLGSMRSSLIIGITMPVSVFTTFIGMYFAGMTLNVVSLGGLALGVGMLVDNAVVVLENIYRRRKSFGEKASVAAIVGSKEVVGAVVASVLTTCIVYVPILFIDGIMVIMFRQLAFSIIFSQVASLITTFLLIPMLSARVKDVDSRGPVKNIILKPFDLFMKGLYAGYNKLIRFALRHRGIVVGVILAMFAGCLVVLGGLGMELMPASDEGLLTVNIEMPLGTKLEDTDAMTRDIEEIVQSNELIESVFTTVSGSSIMGSGSGNTASIQATLIDKDRRKESTADVVELLRNDLSGIAGAEITIEASSSTSMSMGSTAGVSFQLSGDDLDSLEQYAKEAVEVLKAIDGVREPATSLSETKTETRIYLNREKVARYGLTTASAANLIKTCMNGQTASRFTDAGTEYDIVVRLPDSQTSSLDDLRNLKLRAGSGQWITIEDIADINMEQGYTTINRENQKRVVTVSAQVYGSDIATVTNTFNEKMAQITPPAGCSMQASGSYETMMESFGLLMVAIVIGLLLMYMVMAAQFESLLEPLLIMGSVPMALIGVVIALVIDGAPLNIISCIGLLMLTGMIVNNAIILLDFINSTTREGVITDRTEIVVGAGMTRMRPVLMTTVTSVLGFLPMVLSTAEGSEMMRPLAVVLLGGLAIGTVLTLVFVPVLYTIADDRKQKRRRRKEKRLKKKPGKTQPPQGPNPPVV